MPAKGVCSGSYPVGYNSSVRVLPLILLLGLTASNSSWTIQTTGLNTNLRGVSVSLVGDHLYIWACGSNGIVLRSIDHGKWKQVSVQGAATFDFRDVEAFGKSVAYLMSSGDGDKSRIYKTTDGGRSWRLQYSDSRPGFFLDSLACRSENECVGLSDPVNGKFIVLRTIDGEHWNELSNRGMPPALQEEGAFAASGTAMAWCESGIYFGTGGPGARIFHSSNDGKSWVTVEPGIKSGSASSGVFSVACDRNTVVAVGGDYKSPDRSDRVSAFSTDQGKTWHITPTQPRGYRSAVATLGRGRFLAVGPGGADRGNLEHADIRWEPAGSESMNAITFVGSTGWAVGPSGTIFRFKDLTYGRQKCSN